MSDRHLEERDDRAQDSAHPGNDDWNEGLDHHLYHGASGGGPDPDCRLCEDA